MRYCDSLKKEQHCQSKGVVPQLQSLHEEKTRDNEKQVILFMPQRGCVSLVSKGSFLMHCSSEQTLGGSCLDLLQAELLLVLRVCHAGTIHSIEL